MQSERRERHVRQYRRLGWGEWCAACVFVYVTAFSLDDGLASLDATAAVWWALMPLLAVLVQAGAYWLAARSWVGVSSMPRLAALAVLMLRPLNVIALIAAAVGIAVTWPSSNAGAILAVAIWLFAVAEFANYFVIRLAYRPRDVLRGIATRRTPRLMLDARQSPEAAL